MATQIPCPRCEHAWSEHRPGLGCIEATWDGEEWQGCECEAEEA